VEEKKILRLLADWEHALLDYKEDFYNPSDDKSKTDFVKDIISMANSTLEKPGYIICGVRVLVDGRKEIVGVNPNTYVDDNNWISILNQYASHPIHFRFHKQYLKEFRKYVVIIEVFTEQERPIICKKDHGEKLKKGLIYFRNGSNNDIAADLVTIEKMIFGTVKDKKSLSDLKLSVTDPTYNRYSKFPSPPYYSFIGREKEIELIKSQLLSHHKNYLLALNGDGGIGKTSIAYKVAEELLREIRNGKSEFDDVIWISAKNQRIYFDQRLPLTPEFNSIEDLYDKILLVFYDYHYISKLDIEKKSELVDEALSISKFFIVLDNMEVFSHEELEQIKKFISNAPPAHKFLLTSRHDLRVQEIIKVSRLEPHHTKEYITDVFRAFDLIGTEIADQIEERSEEFDKLTNGNPLYIKFFIAQMKNGRSLNDILKNRNKESEKALMAYCFDTTLESLSETHKKVIYSLAISNSTEQQQLSFQELRYLNLLEYQQLHDVLDDLLALSMIERSYFNNKLFYSINSLLGSYLLSEKLIPAAEIAKLRNKLQNLLKYSRPIEEQYVFNFGLDTITQPNEKISYNIIIELLETKDKFINYNQILEEAKLLHRGNYIVIFLKYYNSINSNFSYQLYIDIHTEFANAQQYCSDPNELLMMRAWKYLIYFKINRLDEIIKDIENNGIPEDSTHSNLLYIILATAYSLKAKEEYYRQQYTVHNQLRDKAEEIYNSHLDKFIELPYFYFIKKFIIHEYNEHIRHYKKGGARKEIGKYQSNPKMLWNFELFN